MTDRDKATRHSLFYVDTVIFQVEDCLFRVPREPFEQESSIFHDMFSLTQDDKDAVEGLSDEKPIRLDGVSKNDFEQLLKVLFHRKLGPLPCLPVSIEEWTSVLKLSTTWEFKVTRQAAIDALDVLQIGPVDRVALARKYNIKSWLLPALNKLAQRPKPTSLEEAGRMGIDFALKLASVREGITATHTSSDYSGAEYCNSCSSLQPRRSGKKKSKPRSSCNPPQLHLSQTSRVILGSSRDDVQSLDFTSQIRTAFGL